MAGIAADWIPLCFRDAVGGAATSTFVALSMLIVALIALFLLICRPLQVKSAAAALLVYYLYIVVVSVCNDYFSEFLRQPTLVVACAFWIFIFLMFTECGRQQSIKVQTFSKIFFALTLVCFALFCRYYATNQDVESQLSGLNVVYYILFMLPIVLMGENKIIVGIGIIINILAVLLSGKRGALIAVLVAVLIWAWTENTGKITVKKLLKTLLYIGLAVAATFAVFSLVDRLGLNILDRMGSFLSGEDDGSGRVDIWMVFWKHMKKDSFLYNFFGRGYNATKLNPTLKDLGMSWAHNDFLQILFDYGVVGFLLFATFVVRLFKAAGEMRKHKYRYYRQFFISLIVFLLCCSYSMVTLNPQWFLAMAAFWGIVIGDFEQERGISK